MERIKLTSNIDVKIMPRLEVLYYFVYELAESFGVEEDVLDSIKTGILDNQILEQVSIQYKNSEGIVVGKIIIDIDWEKHFCLAKTESGKYFEIDLSKSVVENIVNWKKYIVLHTQEIRKQFNVVKIDGRYCYRKQIVKDKEQYDKALKIMGHILAPSDKEDIDIELSKKLARVVEDSGYLGKQKSEYDSMDKVLLNCGDMTEVALTIYSKKN